MVEPVRVQGKKVYESKSFPCGIYLDAIPDVQIVLDTGKKVVFANKAVEDLTGYSREEITGMGLESIPFLKIALELEQGKEIEQEMTRKDGSRFYGLLRLDPIEGRGYMLTVRNMTLVKKREEELKNSAKIMEQIINSMPVALMLLDKEGKVSSTNPAMEEITGYHWKEIVGKRFPEQKFMTEEAMEVSRTMWKEHVSKGEAAINYDMPIIDINGNEHILSISEVGLRDAKGEVTWMYIGKDVTEERKGEMKLKEAVSNLGSVLSKAVMGDLSARVDLSQMAEEYKSIGEGINEMVSATEKNVEETRKRESELQGVIETFGSVLSSATQGELEARVDPSKIPEDYRPIGEDINEMISATQKNIEELYKRESSLKSAISSFSIALSRAAQGDLTAKVDLSQIAEEYKSIGENINKMISATKEREEELKEAIKEIGAVLSKISEGNLTVKLDESKISEEYRPIAEDINRMVESVRALVNRAREVSTQVASSVSEMTNTLKEMGSSAQQITTTVGQLSQGASNLASLSQNMQALSDRLKQIMESIASASYALSETSEEASKRSAEGWEATTKMKEVSDSYTHSMDMIAETAEALSVNVQGINEVVEIITSIADQTNLLALNAAIEAARAGEQGKAFSVVADEIRKLADQSRGSIQRIREMVSSISEQREKLMKVVEDGRKNASNAAETVRASSDAFSTIIKGLEEIVNGIRDISQFISEESDTVNELAKNVEEVSAVAEENAASVEESSASIEEQTAGIEEVSAKSEEMNDAVVDLTQVLSVFRG